MMLNEINLGDASHNWIIVHIGLGKCSVRDLTPLGSAVEAYRSFLSLSFAMHIDQFLSTTIAHLFSSFISSSNLLLHFPTTCILIHLIFL